MTSSFPKHLDTRKACFSGNVELALERLLAAFPHLVLRELGDILGIDAGHFQFGKNVCRTGTFTSAGSAIQVHYESIFHLRIAHKLPRVPEQDIFIVSISSWFSLCKLGKVMRELRSEIAVAIAVHTTEPAAAHFTKALHVLQQ